MLEYNILYTIYFTIFYIFYICTIAYKMSHVPSCLDVMLYVAELNTKDVIHSIAHNFILQSQAGSVLRQKLPAGAEQNLGWEGRVEQAVSASSLTSVSPVDLFCSTSTTTRGKLSTALHTGNPGVEKSKKIISLNIAILVRVKTDLVRARLSMEGSIIKN